MRDTGAQKAVGINTSWTIEECRWRGEGYSVLQDKRLLYHKGTFLMTLRLES